MHYLLRLLYTHTHSRKCWNIYTYAHSYTQTHIYLNKAEINWLDFAEWHFVCVSTLSLFSSVLHKLHYFDTFPHVIPNVSDGIKNGVIRATTPSIRYHRHRHLVRSNIYSRQHDDFSKNSHFFSSICLWQHWLCQWNFHYSSRVFPFVSFRFFIIEISYFIWHFFSRWALIPRLHPPPTQSAAPKILSDLLSKYLWQ